MSRALPVLHVPDLPDVTIVTGTDTDVGKTVVTAALAAAQTQRGRTVALVKPAQTGLDADEPGDVHVAAHLAGLPADAVHELARLPEPLAPTTAAARAGLALPTVDEVASTAASLMERYDGIIIEGAGGVLVGLDGEGRTLLDLADALTAQGHKPGFVVAARPGLGTLNHTALTCRVIRDAGHDVAGVVLGSWPERPDLAMQCNAAEIAEIAGAPLWGALPAGIGSDPGALRASVVGHDDSLTPQTPTQE